MSRAAPITDEMDLMREPTVASEHGAEAELAL